MFEGLYESASSSWDWVKSKVSPQPQPQPAYVGGRRKTYRKKSKRRRTGRKSNRL